MKSDMPDLVWRATISGLLKELTVEMRALTEVVMVMNEKLAEQEEVTRSRASLRWVRRVLRAQP